jgi:hypothetical protein
LPIPAMAAQDPASRVVCVLSNLYVADEVDPLKLQELGVAEVVCLVGSKSASLQHRKVKTFYWDGDLLSLVYLILPRIQNAMGPQSEGPILIHADSAQCPDAAFAMALCYMIWE